MQRMLTGLRQNQPQDQPATVVTLDRLVTEVVTRRATDTPRPRAAGTARDVVVLGDAERLANVIEHLVQNAQQATPAGGSVEVELQRHEGEAVLRIRDTGCGMDKEFIDKRLFRPFDSTKGNAGMGIGVYESRHVVQHHGGRLEVESAPGSGTTFTIFLPLYRDAAITSSANKP
jgi:signal transduction histidine kinase